MSMDWIKRIAGDKPEIDNVDEISSGTQRLRGTVKCGPETVSSPVKNVPCAAFYYYASYKVQGRTGPSERLLKSCELYSPVFFLEMNGGFVRVLSKKKGEPFDNAGHRALKAGAPPRAEFLEQLVRNGTQLSIKGKVSKDDEGWFISPKVVTLLEEPPKKKPQVRRPTSRKPQAKKKKQGKKGKRR